MPSHACRVSFTDSEGIEHAVEVVATSQYEAAVLALAEFWRCGLADATFGPSTRLKLLFNRLKEEHELSVGKLQTWFNGSSKSPREHVQRNRLKRLLTS